MLVAHHLALAQPEMMSVMMEQGITVHMLADVRAELVRSRWLLTRLRLMIRDDVLKDKNAGTLSKQLLSTWSPYSERGHHLRLGVR